jgi:hypothetical protein
MEKFTIAEKEILLQSLEHYIDAGERTRHILTGEDKDKFIQELWKIKELRAKLILDLNSIIVISNNSMYSFNCCLCGQGDDSGYPKQATIEGYGDICFECFKKYKPELYEKTMKENYATETLIDIPEGTDLNNLHTEADSLPF